MARRANKPAVEAKVTAVAAENPKKGKKAYPSTDERIEMANKKIEKLTALNEKRQALIAETEATLTQRQESLAKSTAALAKEIAKRDRLIASKLSPAVLREKKSIRKAQIAKLLDTLESSGKSVDDLFAMLSQD